MTISRREYDFQAARHRLEGKAKSAGEKLTTIDDAVARVKNGDHVAFGGCLFLAHSLALVRALLRRRPTGLSISRNLMCYEGEWCMVAGAVDKIVTSWMGIGLPWGLSKIHREYVESGRVSMEEWSHLALGLRFRAAAMGVSFLPSLTMMGSSLVDVGGSKIIDCPYTGEKLLAVPALFPDVALLHVHRADRFGNCQIDGYPHMDSDIARAAATVVVTAEEIVSEEEIRLHPDRTVIPGFAVDALVHVPYGSLSPRVLRALRRRPRPLLHLCRRHQPARRGRRAGLPRPLRLRSGYPCGIPLALRGDRARRRRATRPGARVVSGPAHGVTSNELLAVMGSRELKDNTTVFAGVGAPMLASGLAQRMHAPLLTMVIEGGIVGRSGSQARSPSPPTRCARPIAPRCCPASRTPSSSPSAAFSTWASSGAPRSTATATSTRAPSAAATTSRRCACPARGANDIISLCREVIILTVHEKRRFTDTVDFITSPGWLSGRDARRKSGLLFGGVGRVVTTMGVFGFDPESRQMRLEALHTGVSVDEVKANTGFDVLVSDALTTTKPPTDEELGILRMMDPARQFL